MTLLERVRRSLEPNFEVRREIGRGGMGVVFEATDRRLEHAVAIKVLQPELATAPAVERFLREGRALAAISHPCVVAVHGAGESEGLHYFVMDFIAGPTLAQRLEDGRLTRPEFEDLQADLLSALEAIHDAGFVHRDIKPSNIFFEGGRAVLGDFGIVSSSPDPPVERLTATGEFVGTPGYIAPEQRAGVASPATDVYAAAEVLYEAFTGTYWRDAGPHPWARVPRRLRGPLRRGLERSPDRRPANGAAFTAEFSRAQRRRRWLGAGLGAAIAGALALVLLLADGESPASAGTVDLALRPFEAVGSPADAELARHIWTLTTLNLEGLEGLTVLPAAQASRAEAHGTTEARPLRIAGGTLLTEGDSLVVRVAVQDSGGRPLGEVRVGGHRNDRWGAADSVALALLRLVAPHLRSAYGRLEGLHTDDLQAAREFLLGEDAFNNNAWSSAEEHYGTALERDPGFTLALWRLWLVHGWSMAGDRSIDLTQLARHADELGTVDAALLRAEAMPPGKERIDALREVVRRFGHSRDAWFLLGEEHYHRGPLAGGSLEQAADYFAEAAARDPDFAPAYEHRVFVLARLGRERDAEEALRNLQRTATPPAPGDSLDIPTLLAQVVRERFRPLEAAQSRELLDPSDPDWLPALMFVARMGLEFDIPEAQIELGRRMAGHGSPTVRVQGHTARALALIVQGQAAQAIANLDSVAALRSRVAALDDAGTAGLEAAEWRVVGPALGIVGVPNAEMDAGRVRLRAEAESGSEGAGRAAWALVVDAWARGDSAEAGRWRRALAGLENRPGNDRLGLLSDAFRALAEARPGEVLRLTAPLLARQYAPDPGYPFTRSALHVVRARAFEAMGDWRSALAERAWADNRDTIHELTGPLQAVEVDWALSPYSDRHRARAALATADTAAACRLLDRVRRLWTGADAGLDPLRAADTALAGDICS